MIEFLVGAPVYISIPVYIWLGMNALFVMSQHAAQARGTANDEPDHVIYFVFMLPGILAFLCTSVVIALIGVFADVILHIPRQFARKK